MAMLPIGYHARHLLVRRTTTAATVLGVAAAALVVAAAPMAIAGLERALGGAGREEVAVVLLDGADGELTSQFDAPAAARAAALAPAGAAASAEVVVTMTVTRRGGGGASSNLVLRGVDGTAAAAVRPGLLVVAGRAPREGAEEIMVGRAVVGRFEGLALGEQVALGSGARALVVGVFADGGGAAESEVWGPRGLVERVSGREGIVSSVRVRLAGAEALPGFRAALRGYPELALAATAERELLETQGRRVTGLVRGLGALVGALLALAAALGAAVTMHAQVAHRRREIGVLRALGWSRRAVLLGFLGESAALALAGGALGLLGAWALDGASLSLMNVTSFTEVRVTLSMTPGALAAALAVAAVVGVGGGLLPALRAARVPPGTVLR